MPNNKELLPAGKSPRPDFEKIITRLDNLGIETQTGKKELWMIFRWGYNRARRFDFAPLIVELGGYQMYVSQMLATIGEVISIDINFSSKKVLEELKPAINIIEKDAILASNQISDNSIDILYIDANHAYDDVYRQLDVYYPKMKKDWRCPSLILGHDYSPSECEVVMAVEQWKRDNSKKWIGWGRYKNLFWMLVNCKNLAQ